MWIFVVVACLVVNIALRRQIEAADRWLIQTGMVSDNRWSFFVLAGVALAPGGTPWGWAVAAGHFLTLWWDRTPPTRTDL